MNFPKEKVIRINGEKVSIIPYLTTALIGAILETISTQSDYAIRCAMADCMVLHQCTNLEDFKADEVDIATYDIYKANGVVDTITREINGYDILLSGIADLSIKDVYRSFEDVIQQFTQEFKNIDLEGQQKKFEETLNELHKVEAKKEEILNG